jgi:2-octaprenylphenol hydroxylase
MSARDLAADVIIVGGGPVGLLLGVLLAQHGRHDVLLLDARSGFAVPQGIDPRVYALSRASQQLLQRCGAWPALADGHAWAYRRMHVWDAARPRLPDGELVFDAADVGEPDLGHIVENARLEMALREAAAHCSGFRLQTHSRVQSLQLDATGATVTCADGLPLRARLVVAADGAGSGLRELAGIEVLSRDYRQHALVTHVQTEFPHRDTAWQRFLPTGPVALLPLGDGRCSVVWSMDDALAGRLGEAGDALFAAALTEATEGVLGRVGAVQPRLMLKLRLLHAKRYVARRFALVGDAAHVVHPLAGQGANLGLRDAGALASALADAHDPGEQRLLRRYERARKADNVTMLAALDGLQRLFGSSTGPLPMMRTLGLGLVNRSAPVKRALMRRALGTG